VPFAAALGEFLFATKREKLGKNSVFHPFDSSLFLDPFPAMRHARTQRSQ
jgi:hypothetical protein